MHLINTLILDTSKEFSSCKLCKANVELVNPVFKLVECTECGFVFAKTIFSEQDFIETYRNLYNGDVKKAYFRYSVNEYNELLNGVANIGYNRKRIIQNYLEKQGLVVEIGSGIGLIGTYLKRFEQIEYIGLELDAEAHEKAKKLGLNSVNGDFSQLENLPNNIDTIMMWEVFEHLQDLKLFFAIVDQKLKRGGAVILSVPNYDKRLNYKRAGEIDYELYQDPPPVHLNFFTEKSLKKTFESHNFTIELLDMKKMPYVNIRSKTFYKNLLKAIVGRYNGSTLFLKAVKST